MNGVSLLPQSDIASRGPARLVFFKDVFPELDGLRAIAVPLVLWSHISAAERAPILSVVGKVLRPGYLGVDIFFVLLLSFAVATTSFYVVERPILRLQARFQYPAVARAKDSSAQCNLAAVRMPATASAGGAA